MTNVLYMLLGAGIFAIGVLATALADRIRGLRVERDRAVPASMPVRAAVQSRAAIEVIEATPAAPRKPDRASRTDPKTSPQTYSMIDVVAALVAAGYRRTVATAAAQGCSAAERTTIEAWTYAALRRAALEGAS